MDYTDNFHRLFSGKGFVFKTATIFVAAIVMLLVFFIAAASMKSLASHPLYIYAVQGFMALFVFLVPALLCGYLFHGYEETTFAYLSQNRLTSLPVFGLGVLLMLVCVVLTGQLGEWNKMVFPEDEAQMQALIQLLTEGDESFLALRLLVMAFIPALTEEMFFRGLLQNTFARYMRGEVAVLIVALVFALAHGDMSGVLPRFVLGALLGYLLLRGGTLWLPIVCHFINNSIVVMATYYFFDPDTQRSSLDAYVEGNIPLFLLCVAGFGGLMWWFWSLTGRTRNLPTDKIF